MIKNFESHKDTHLEFDPGVNTIVGENDTGKSAIIRALRLIINNDPSGLNYLPTWNKKAITENTLETFEGDIITRMRSKSINNYFFNEESLKAFGVGVPDEIIKALNMDEINVQSQKEPDFLFSSTSGQIAKYLNKIVNLEVIDDIYNKLESKRRAANTDLVHHQEQLEKQNKELEKYAKLDQIEKKIERIESLEINYHLYQEKIKQVESSLFLIDQENQSIRKLNLFICYESKILELLSLNSKGMELGSKLDKIIGLFSDIELIKEQNKQINIIIKEENKVKNLLLLCSNQVELEKKIKKITDLKSEIAYRNKECVQCRKIMRQERKVNTYLELCQTLKETESIYDKLQSLKIKIEEEKEQLKIAERNIKKYQDKFDKIKPDNCPLCNGTGKL